MPRLTRINLTVDLAALISGLLVLVSGMGSFLRTNIGPLAPGQEVLADLHELAVALFAGSVFLHAVVHRRIILYRLRRWAVPGNRSFTEQIILLAAVGSALATGILMPDGDDPIRSPITGIHPTTGVLLSILLALHISSRWNALKRSDRQP